MTNKAILLLLSGLLCLFVATAANSQTNANLKITAKITNVRIITSGDVTRIIFNTNQPMQFQAKVIANPYRLVINLPETIFWFERQIKPSGGVVKDLRYGRIARGASRIVIDLKQPVTISQSFFIEKKNNLPGRQVFDLHIISPEQFALTQPADKPEPAPAKPKKATKSNQTPKSLITIVLDPGHGGIDSGAVAPDGSKEKYITLNFTLALKRELERQGLYRIIMTRDNDSFISLAQRVKIAQDSDARLFISIHADKFPDPAINGAIIHTLSKRASDRITARLADNENKSDLLAGVNRPQANQVLDEIFFDLIRQETKSLSQLSARIIVNGLGKDVVSRKNPIRSANFWVLKAWDVPSVLLEIGFLSNKHDLKRINSPNWQTVFVKRMVKAINKYFNTRPRQKSR